MPGPGDIGNVSSNTPYQSVGQSSQVQVNTTTTRQTFADTIASKAVQAGGAILNGAATIGTAVASTLGFAGAANLGSRLAQVGSQAQMTGGSGPVMFSGPSAMRNANEVQAGAGATPTTGAAAAMPGGTSSGSGIAFGAGATALPGGDMSGGTGMGMSSVGGGSVGVGVGMGGASSMSGNSVIGSAAGGDSSSQLLSATKQMQETQMSFNLQYLQLQSQMQNDNRQYTAVSNIMKTKHDTVKNSISNIR